MTFFVLYGAHIVVVVNGTAVVAVVDQNNWIWELLQVENKIFLPSSTTTAYVIIHIRPYVDHNPSSVGHKRIVNILVNVEKIKYTHSFLLTDV